MIKNIEIIKSEAAKHDSFYLYDERGIMEQTSRLKACFPNVEFLYSIKCNSNKQVIRSVLAQGFSVDAASLGEVLTALEAGCKRQHIYFSAPGKTVNDIEQSLSKAVLIADSIGEIERIRQVAEQRGIVANIGIRINPDFSFYSGSGVSSKFGIDEEQAISFLQRQECQNVKITGVHIHLRSQELNADILETYYRNIFRLAERFQRLCRGELEYINMGSGMGIQYSPEDEPLDVQKLGTAVNRLMDEFHNSNPHTRIMIEVGRYAVGKSGIYVTKVLDRKESHGKTYIILKNTLNGFIRPSLAKLVEHYSSEQSPSPSEPLFTSKNAFEFLTLKPDLKLEQVSLVGNLCTATDVMAENIMMPYLEIGDAVIITNAGAYAAVLSPMQFSAQERPVELFLKINGAVIEEE